MTEARQTSVDNSSSSSNKEEEFQPISVEMILEYLEHDLIFFTEFLKQLRFR